MRYCEKCKVSVAGSHRLCPLCQGVLVQRGEDAPEVFPNIPTIHRQHSLFFRLLIFLSVVAGVVSVTVNLMLPQTGGWSFFVVVGIVCLWVSLALAIRKRRNIPKNIMYQVVLAAALSVLWDWITGWRGWSLDFVVPIVCIAAMAAMAVLSKVMPLYVDDYMIYLIIDGIFGLLPLIFYFTGNLNIPYPSLICIAISIISLAGLLLFEGEKMRAELKKRFHL